VAAIGADPEALDGLARTLAASGDELTALASRVDAALRAADWDGPDGDRFRTAWRSAHRNRLRTAAEGCRGLARQVSRHADEQRRAATATGAPTAATRLPPPPVSGRVLRGSIEGSVGPWSAALTGTLHIDDLGHLRRITYEEELGAGVAPTGGSGVRGTFDGSAASAGTTGTVGISAVSTVRRSWTVPRDEVVGLLASLALQESVAGTGGPLTRVGGQVTRAFGALTGTSLGPPALVAPDRTEDLVSIEVGAAAWAALDPDASGSRTATGGLSGEAAVGLAREGDDSWLVLEADGAAAAAFGTLLADGDGLAARGSLRLEVPLHGRADRPMVVTATTEDAADGDREVTRLAVDPVLADAAVDGARRAVDALRRGDVDGASEALRSIRWDPGAVAVDVTTIVAERSDVGLDVAIGPGSVSFAGTDDEWRRRP
jgi:hypothetical protein